jgi:hypothetical protein
MANRMCIWLHARAEYEEPGHEGPRYVTEVTLQVSYDGESVDDAGARKKRFVACPMGPQNTMS